MENLAAITFLLILAYFTQLVPRHNMRQNFIVEDLLEHFDDGTLCGASMFLDRGAECSCLLQDLHHVETSIPVPLKHILPQKFTTSLLVQTLRKIDQLPVSTEASVRESTDSRIIELILDFKTSDKRLCLKCTLKIAACLEELMEE